jgi:hypothetical protein
LLVNHLDALEMFLQWSNGDLWQHRHAVLIPPCPHER